MGKLGIITTCLSVILFAYVFELVRRRHLNEEYSFGWMVAAVFIIFLSVWRGFLEKITVFIGGTNYPSTIFFFGFIFLIIINLHFSIRISALTKQVRRLTQKLAIQMLDLEEKKEKNNGSTVKKA